MFAGPATGGAPAGGSFFIERGLSKNRVRRISACAHDGDQTAHDHKGQHKGQDAGGFASV